MRLHYSKEADALYIRLKENEIKDSDEVAEGIVMDYDDNGNIIGIEILWVSEKADISQLIVQAFDRVTVASSN